MTAQDNREHDPDWEDIDPVTGEPIATPDDDDHGVQRYPTSRARNISENVKRRVRWRRRTKRRNRSQTDAEKKAKAAERAAKRDEFSEMIKAAVVRVREIAKDLHNKADHHSEDFYFELLMQHAGKIVQERAVNRWNAFISLRLREINDGPSTWQHRSYTPD